MASSVELILNVLSSSQWLIAQAATSTAGDAAATAAPVAAPAAAAAGLVSSVMSTAWLVFLVAIGVGLVIFVHELGHFLAAKWCGVKVEKFYVGFDFPIKIGPLQLPRTLGRFRYGETEYGIGTIPLGGYVKMLGQDEDPRNMEAEAQRVRLPNSDQATEGDWDEDRPVQLDPRSFPAKSVWQRMIIISAGVVMNLITGVLFAAVAFLYGVPYQPAIVGDTVPGTPAYAAGVLPGGKVVSVGRIDRDEQLHFTEMASAVLLAATRAPDQAVPVTIEYAEGTVRDYSLQTAPVAAQPGRRLVGLTPMNTTFFPNDAERLGQRQSATAVVLTAADAGAEVISVNGEAVPGAGENDNILGSVMLHRAVFANPNQPLTLGLRRSDGSSAEVTIAAQSMLMPQVAMAVGAIKAVVTGSPADQAGIQPGDVLVSVDGVQNLCAFALPSQLADRTDSIRMQLRRGNDDGTQIIDVELTPAEPTRGSSPINPMDNTIAVDRLGFAYEALPQVASVLDSASGFQPGDVWKKVQFRWEKTALPAFLQESASKQLRDALDAGWEFDVEHTLGSLVDLWQLFPAGTELTVVVSRDGKITEVPATLTSNGQHWPDRGLLFADLKRTQVAAGLGDSLALGYRAAERRLTEVFHVLGMLVTRKANPNMIGGPITIFRVAGQEASRGIPTLLMFLTMLSMNLAILNFLPIPALDGGHMLFLIAEAVLGRPVDERLQMQLTMAGVLALLSLMAFAVLNDLRRW